MLTLLQRVVFMLMLAGFMVGCADLASGSRTTSKAGSDNAKVSAPSRQRQMLNDGYSMLYKDAGSFDLAELILYVKVESDAVDGIVTAVAHFGGDLKKQLKDIARDYPEVRIDLDPLPEIEKRKRAALGKDRARYFAPVIGHGGREYERTILIAYANGINHERHLCQVMAEAEPDAKLKKFLIDTETRYDGLYERINTLLEKEYFKDPSGKTRY